MLTDSNNALIQEYLDIAINASEDLDRFSRLLSEDCIWRIMPPGVDFIGVEQVKSFSGMAMGSRSHSAGAKIEIRNWFAEGENFCVEYFHAALITRFHIRVVENVCLVCHMREGKFDHINEYVDTSGSILIGLGLRLLPLIVKLRSLFDKS
ncbi:MAG TPA: nuclear transport factor 2 family protein [Aggregatilineales bacterium]|nr:nuclear transport factor 2 family protein [Aggregatilineales bacterium]